MKVLAIYKGRAQVGKSRTRPSFSEQQLDSWKAMQVTDPVAMLEIEKAIRNGKELRKSRELTPQEAVRLCLLTNWEAPN